MERKKTHGSPSQSATVGIRIFQGIGAGAILQANERQATLSPMTIICGKTEAVSVILSQRLDFETC